MDGRVSHVLGTMMELISTWCSLGQGREGMPSFPGFSRAGLCASINPSPFPGMEVGGGWTTTCLSRDQVPLRAQLPGLQLTHCNKSLKRWPTEGCLAGGLPFWGSSRPSPLPNTRMQALHQLTTHAWRRQNLARLTQ